MGESSSSKELACGIGLDGVSLIFLERWRQHLNMIKRPVAKNETPIASKAIAAADTLNP
jgi:hypothetical protein